MSTPRNRKVCTQCRQAKSRCDAATTFPLPCSRCSRLPEKPLCRSDSTFKRITKRVPKRTNDEAQDSSPSSVAAPESLGCPAESDQWALNPVAEDLFTSPPILPPWTSDFTLGSVVLTPTLGDYFIDSYYNFVHSLCPILLYRRTASTAFVQTPFLFWSMVWAATQSSSAMAEVPESVSETILDNLAAEIKEMVARMSIDPGRTVDYVQGLLLLCEWPFPSTRIRETRTWHYSSLATQLCLNNGYHRPYHSKEFFSPAHFQSNAVDVTGQEQTLAWAYTQIVSHNCAANLGLPSLAHDDWVTRQVAVSPSETSDICVSYIPLSVRQGLRLSSFDNDVAIELGRSPNSSSGQAEGFPSAMIRRFLRQVDEIEQALGAPADATISVRILLSRTRVCAFGLQSGGCEGSPGDYSSKLRLDYYTASVQLLNIMVSLGWEVFGSWPDSVLIGACLSAVGLCKILTIASDGELDNQAAIQMLENYLEATTRLVKRDKDTFFRFTHLLRFVLQDYQPGNSSRRFPVSICSRMGLANWFYEAIGNVKVVRGFHEAEYPTQGSAIDPIE